jgi:hypothetical protein
MHLFPHNKSHDSNESNIPVEEIAAIAEFLSAHPEWKVRERFVNNNGLTVLERIDHL